MRANYRRLSVPFEANPIIRNETASFHSLVQAHLFILCGSERREGGEEGGRGKGKERKGMMVKGR